MAILANQMDLSRPVSLRKLIGYLSGDNAVQFNSAGLPETSGIAASATWTLQNTNYWGQAPINPGTIGTNQTAEQVEIPHFISLGIFVFINKMKMANYRETESNGRIFPFIPGIPSICQA
jgi:hypothetical protein